MNYERLIIKPNIDETIIGHTGITFPLGLAGIGISAKLCALYGMPFLERMPVRNDSLASIQEFEPRILRQHASWNGSTGWRDVGKAIKSNGLKSAIVTGLSYMGMPHASNLGSLDDRLPTVIYPQSINWARSVGFKEVSMHATKDYREIEHFPKGYGVVLDTQHTPNEDWKRWCDLGKLHLNDPESGVCISELHVRVGPDVPGYRDQLNMLLSNDTTSAKSPLEKIRQAPDGVPVVSEVTMLALMMAKIRNFAQAYATINSNILSAMRNRSA